MALSKFTSLTPPSASSVAEVPSISSTTLAVGFSSTKVSSAYAFVESKTNADIERHNARIIAMSTLFLFESLFTIFPPTPLECFFRNVFAVKRFLLRSKRNGISRPKRFIESYRPTCSLRFNYTRQTLRIQYTAAIVLYTTLT